MQRKREMILPKPYPLYPLCEDYDSLTAEGQRQARLAVLCDHSTPMKLVEAWDFFRKVYLAGSEQQPFYKDGFCPSPEFHSDMMYGLGAYAMNAWAAPRGSAKSTVMMEAAMLLALTKPHFETMLLFSTDRQKTPRFDTLMAQFQRNELILEDFGVMAPKRGTMIWNHEHLQLTNGAIITGQSVMGKKRGGRPRLLFMDDPENDPDSDSETSRAAVLEKFETILFKQMIPMLKQGSCLFWIGTLIDRKSFLYRATTGDDPRFDFWNRVVLRAITYDKTDKAKATLLWPEMWPRDFLESRREAIGVSAFASEYCNEPISDQDRILIIDPRKNEYSVDGEFNWDNPLQNRNVVQWNERVFSEDNDHRVYLEMERPFNELVGPMFKILLFDYAYGLTSYHDYSCIAICGFDTLGAMWVLDMWLGRAKDDTLTRLIYEKGLAWNVRILGIEAVSIQKNFAEAAAEYTRERGASAGDLWRPRVFPITYPSKETKAQRMGSLEWRCNSGRLKYPAHLQNEWPWNQLYAQTADFTMDLALLQHDDALDTLGMSKHVIKTKGGQFKREVGKAGLLERIIKNQPLVPGMPVLSGVSTSAITGQMLNIMSQQRRKRNVQPHLRRIERQKPRIIK